MNDEEQHQIRPTIAPPPPRFHQPAEHITPPSAAPSQPEVVADMVAEAVAAAMIANKSQSATPDTVRRAARAGAMKAVT